MKIALKIEEDTICLVVSLDKLVIFGGKTQYIRVSVGAKTKIPREPETGKHENARWQAFYTKAFPDNEPVDNDYFTLLPFQFANTIG